MFANGNNFFGLSTDTKPSSPNAAWTFFELDTARVYTVVSSVWVLKSLLATSRMPIPFVVEAAEESEYPYIIPGSAGVAGAQGIQGNPGTGSDGKNGIPGIDAEESEYPYVIPGPTGPQGIPGSGGGNLALTKLSATTNESITAGYGVDIQRSYLINSGIKVTVGSGARMRIL
jgi:hypothetical protein